MSKDQAIDSIDILLLGHGNVGSAFAALLQEKHEAFEQRWGLKLNLAGIVRQKSGAVGGLSDEFVFTDIDKALAKTQPQIVVELIGGIDDAFEMIQKSLEAGAHVVTANKAVLAAKGAALYDAAAAKNQLLLGEASVAGAVPVLRTLHTSLASDRVDRIVGVWNGTCNYILTRMERESVAFDDVLADAQRLGYAEPDPTLDIGGGDTAHKAVVLGQLAFGVFDPIEEDEYRGITEFTPQDLRQFADLELRPKLIGMLERHDGGLLRYVGPALLPKIHSIAALDSIHNGIYLETKDTGSVFLSGPGAGPKPTATAVLGDVIEIARLHASPGSGTRWGQPAIKPLESLSYENAEQPCYVRVTVKDEPGVLARLATSFAEHDISIRSVDQPVTKAGEDVPLFFTTQRAPLSRLKETLTTWKSMDVVIDQPFWLPIFDKIV